MPLRGRNVRPVTSRAGTADDWRATTEAGIAEADITTPIDGSPAAGFTLSEIIDLFEKPVARELTIRRDERTFKDDLRGVSEDGSNPHRCETSWVSGDTGTP